MILAVFISIDTDISIKTGLKYVCILTISNSRHVYLVWGLTKIRQEPKSFRLLITTNILKFRIPNKITPGKPILLKARLLIKKGLPHVYRSEDPPSTV